jgi:hypothetical protein
MRRCGASRRHPADSSVPAGRPICCCPAATGKVVNVKKGQFLAPWDMANVVAKITSANNPNVLVTERGVSSATTRWSRTCVRCQALGIKRGLAVDPILPPRHDIWPVLLTRVCGLFFGA